MNIRVFLVAYDSGHYQARMGCGPARLWESGLKQLAIGLGHSIDVEEIKVSDSFCTEIKTTFALCSAGAQRVSACLRTNEFPLVLSGNCDIAVGAVSGCGCGNTGVVWFDAHGESTTPETTASGFLDGMGISILTGQCWAGLSAKVPGFKAVPGKQILLVGSRDLETSEGDLLHTLGITRSTPEDMETDILSLAAHVDGVYLHVDLDVLDPSEAIANQWPVSCGLWTRSVLAAVTTIARHLPIRGMGIASYDPAVDQQGRASGAALKIVEHVLKGAGSETRQSPDRRNEAFLN